MTDVIISVSGGVAEVQEAHGLRVAIIDHDHLDNDGDLLMAWEDADDDVRAILRDTYGESLTRLALDVGA